MLDKIATFLNSNGIITLTLETHTKETWGSIPESLVKKVEFQRLQWNFRFCVCQDPAFLSSKKVIATKESTLL